MEDFDKIDGLIRLAEDGEGTPRWAQISVQARDLIAFSRTFRDQTSGDKDIQEFRKLAFDILRHGTRLLTSLGYRSFARKLDVQIAKYAEMPEPRVPPDQEPEEEPKKEPETEPEGEKQ